MTANVPITECFLTLNAPAVQKCGWQVVRADGEELILCQLQEYGGEMQYHLSAGTQRDIPPILNKMSTQLPASIRGIFQQKEAGRDYIS